MNATWGPQDQPPPPIPDPARLCPEHGWLALAVIAITASTLALAVEQLTAVIVFRGAYSVLAGLFVAGIVGWIVGAAERRVRRDLGGAVAELTTELAALREQVTQQRIIYLPTPERNKGHMYASGRADTEQSRTPASRPPAVDPQELREQVEQVVIEELGTRESVRAEGYAEGYVDGVSRRDGETPTT